MNSQSNPILDFSGLPRFDAIRPEHVVPAIDTLVHDCRNTAEQVALPGTPATWVVTTFPIRLESTAPALASYLDSTYTVAHVVPASIGGGEVRILRRRPASR